MDHDYIKWLIDDQAHSLLNMRYEQIASVMGITRQTLAVYVKKHSYDLLTAKAINKLVRHLEYVKLAILTTEESKSL